MPAPLGWYWWDTAIDPAIPLAPLPEWLVEAIRPRVEAVAASAPDYLMPGLSRYGRAALDGAGKDIMSVAPGKQEVTLNNKSFWIGQLVAGWEIPRGLAKDAMIFAVSKMPNYDPQNPWLLADITKKIEDSISAGCRKPAVPTKERKNA
ncbi:MAG: hypothetical protein GC191_18600 [Azospirillum sp.]|nr:hypothetical protein [Azospirillum sp.]